MTILEVNIVTFRNSEGKAVAFEDRCSHRLLPLTRGKRIGADVQCGYHGMISGCEGKYVRIPSQEIVPASAYADSYMVNEKHDIVWIRMGKIDCADVSKIFDLPQVFGPQMACSLKRATSFEKLTI